MLRQPRSKLRSLGFSSLEKYYESNHWKQFTIDFFFRNALGCFCRGLGCNGDEIKLRVYHITYDRLGNEEYSDAISLCRNHRQLIEEVIDKYKIKRKVAHILVKDIVWFHNYRRREKGNGVEGNLD